MELRDRQTSSDLSPLKGHLSDVQTQHSDSFITGTINSGRNRERRESTRNEESTLSLSHALSLPRLALRALVSLHTAPGAANDCTGSYTRGDRVARRHDAGHLKRTRLGNRTRNLGKHFFFRKRIRKRYFDWKWCFPSSFPGKKRFLHTAADIWTWRVLRMFTNTVS